MITSVSALTPARTNAVAFQGKGNAVRKAANAAVDAGATVVNKTKDSGFGKGLNKFVLQPVKKFFKAIGKFFKNMFQKVKNFFSSKPKVNDPNNKKISDYGYTKETLGNNAENFDQRLKNHKEYMSDLEKTLRKRYGAANVEKAPQVESLSLPQKTAKTKAKKQKAVNNGVGDVVESLRKSKTAKA